MDSAVIATADATETTNTKTSMSMPNKLSTTLLSFVAPGIDVALTMPKHVDYVRITLNFDAVDTEHLFIERLKEVLAKCEFLREDEQRHLDSCMTCLTFLVHLWAPKLEILSLRDRLTCSAA